MIPRRPRGLSLGQQALALRTRYPTAKVTIRSNVLAWVGVIHPTPCSHEYKVKIVYRAWSVPKVTVVTPLEGRPGEFLPHTYSDGSLCLHEMHEWTPAMLIAATTIPWAAEWLAHYELWKVDGRWYGDDNHTDPWTEPVPLVPTSTGRSRADRRSAWRP